MHDGGYTHSRMDDDDWLAALHAAYQQAAARVTATADSGERWRRASELLDACQRLPEAAAQLRATVAAGIHRDSGLSLAGLASELSVSKTRASQMVQRGREGHSDGE